MSEVRLPNPGETWKFPNGVTIQIPAELGDCAYDSEKGQWSGGDCTLLAYYGAIVPYEPEVYEWQETVSTVGGHVRDLTNRELTELFPGDTVKVRVEVIRK